MSVWDWLGGSWPADDSLLAAELAKFEPAERAQLLLFLRALGPEASLFALDDALYRREYPHEV